MLPEHSAQKMQWQEKEKKCKLNTSIDKVPCRERRKTGKERKE